MNSRRIKIAYWGVLAIMTAGILVSAIPSVLKLPYAVDHFCRVLQLPEYLLVFTGAVKILGLIALYVPGYARLKEWVFAGFAFDLTGAWYSNFFATQSLTATIPVIVYMAMLALLYYLYSRVYIFKK